MAIQWRAVKGDFLKRFILVLLLGGLFQLSAVASGQARLWQDYVNGRFGTQVLIPASFYKVGNPQNGDGATFISNELDGEIRVYGAYNSTQGGLATYRAAIISYYRSIGARITYQPKGSRWFVLSGYDGDEIFYLRVEYQKGCRPDLLHHILFRYPRAAKTSWDDVVTRGARSLSGPCG